MSADQGIFTCPLCGSHAFRTNTDRGIGICRGMPITVYFGNVWTFDYSGCAFQWRRETQDNLVFGREICDISFVGD